MTRSRFARLAAREAPNSPNRLAAIRHLRGCQRAACLDGHAHKPLLSGL